MRFRALSPVELTYIQHMNVCRKLALDASDMWRVIPRLIDVQYRSFKRWFAIESVNSKYQEAGRALGICNVISKLMQVTPSVIDKQCNTKSFY